MGDRMTTGRYTMLSIIAAYRYLCSRHMSDDRCPCSRHSHSVGRSLACHFRRSSCRRTDPCRHSSCMGLCPRVGVTCFLLLRGNRIGMPRCVSSSTFVYHQSASATSASTSAPVATLSATCNAVLALPFRWVSQLITEGNVDSRLALYSFRSLRQTSHRHVFQRWLASDSWLTLVIDFVSNHSGTSI